MLKENDISEKFDNARWYTGILTLKSEGVSVVLKGYKLDPQTRRILSPVSLNIEPFDLYGKWAEENDCYDWALTMLGKNVEAHFCTKEGVSEIVFVYLDKEKGVSSVEFNKVSITI